MVFNRQMERRPIISPHLFGLLDSFFGLQCECSEFALLELLGVFLLLFLVSHLLQVLLRVLLDLLSYLVKGSGRGIHMMLLAIVKLTFLVLLFQLYILSLRLGSKFLLFSLLLLHLSPLLNSNLNNLLN